MTQTLILVTQTYMAFATPEIWARIASKTRLVLVLREGDTPLPAIAPHAAQIYFVPMAREKNCLPVLQVEPLCDALKAEVERAGSPDGIRVICQDEINNLNVGRCRERLGIPGDRPEVLRKFRNKIAMKEAVAAAGVAVPRYRALDPARGGDAAAYYRELKEILGGKLVLKPVESAASFGVMIVDDEAGFVAAMAEIVRDFGHLEYEVDEFVDGTLYQCDSYVRKGELVYSSVLEINCPGFEFIGGKPLGVFPIPEGTLRSKLADMNRCVLSALGLDEGAMHLEAFVDRHTREPVFLEVAARVVGGIGVPFHRANSNVNLVDLVIASAMEDGSFERMFRPTPNDDTVYALLPLRLGEIVELLEPEVESQYHIDWKVAPGMKVEPRSLIENAGFLMLRNPDRDALRRDFDRLNTYVPVRCVAAAGAM